MDGMSFDGTAAIIEPAVRHVPSQPTDVRPDANRVIYSPLLNVTISQKRQIPFGCLATIPLMEEWFPVRDVPAHARHRVSPDPNDQATWPKNLGDKLPTPTLASVLTNSDLVLARVLQQYAEQGCREIVALRDKSADEIRAIQQKLFGNEQMRSYTQTVKAIQTALKSHSDDKLVVATARELMRQSDEALRACELYWQGRKVEIMRAANGDKQFTAHPDNFDLRICEYAGIDPTQTEADALRAEVLRAKLEPSGGVAMPEAFAEAMKTAIAEGIKIGVAAVATEAKSPAKR